MKRPARHRSSPMELAPRLNPQAQQHCDAFSKHGLWRCECIGSVWVGLYYLNWDSGYCGADFAAGNMGTSVDGFCDNYADQKIVEARGKCLWMRFWKSDGFSSGMLGGWDDYPFAQIVKPLGDFCFEDRAGFNFNICNPPAGQDEIGGLTEFQWCADAASGCSQYELDCSASWPMFTKSSTSTSSIVPRVGVGCHSAT